MKTRSILVSGDILPSFMMKLLLLSLRLMPPYHFQEAFRRMILTLVMGAHYFRHSKLAFLSIDGIVSLESAMDEIQEKKKERVNQ